MVMKALNADVVHFQRGDIPRRGDPFDAIVWEGFEINIRDQKAFDIGKQRERPTVDSARFPPRYVRDGPKSGRWVDSGDERGMGCGAGACEGSSSGPSSDSDEIEDADAAWAREEPEDPIDDFSD